MRQPLVDEKGEQKTRRDLLRKESHSTVKSLRINLDALGMCASTLCMIHCLVFPLLLAALPMWKFSADESESNTAAQLSCGESCDMATSKSPMLCSAQECRAASEIEASEVSVSSANCCATPTDFWIHVGLLAAVAPLGVVAWGAGYRKHRRLGVLALGLAGVLLLSGALLFGNQLLGGRGERVMTVSGSIFMVSAHLWNRRQCRCCRTPDLANLVVNDAAAPASQQVPLTRTSHLTSHTLARDLRRPLEKKGVMPIHAMPTGEPDG